MLRKKNTRYQLEKYIRNIENKNMIGGEQG